MGHKRKVMTDEIDCFVGGVEVVAVVVVSERESNMRKEEERSFKIREKERKGHYQQCVAQMINAGKREIKGPNTRLPFLLRFYSFSLKNTNFSFSFCFYTRDDNKLYTHHQQ